MVACARGCGELVPFDDTGVTVAFCSTCRSTLCPGEHVVRFLGGELDLLPRGTFGQRESEPLACPRGCAVMRTLPPPFAPTRRCDRCASLLLEPGGAARLRALVPRASRSVPAAVSEAVRPAHVLVGERLHFDQRWLDLLVLPAAFLLAALLLSTSLGSLLMVPVQIQFHELGHACFAWLSSRAALPLPFGFTFWREEQSLFTGACLLFLLGVLAQRGLRERRLFPVLLAAAFTLAFCILTFAVPKQTSLMLMVWGGIAGELVLSTLVLLAFRFPMPDRLRWDFFRFVVVVPAAAAWLAAATLWIGVSRGTRRMPMGSILGTAGDGSGDLDRLLAVYDFSEAGIVRSYLSLVFVSAGVLLLHYGFHALKARSLLKR